MFCNNCGKELKEGTKFCPGCGSPVGAAPAVEEVKSAPVESPVAEPAAAVEAAPVEKAPAAGGKKHGKGLLIGGVAVVAVLLVVILLLSGAFTSAKAKVGKAFTKTMDAYTEAFEKAGMPDISKVLESEKFSQKMAVTLTDGGRVGYTDLSVLEGFGISAGIDTNISGKKLGVTGALSYEDELLVSGQFAVEDDKVYLAVPEILGDGVYYGLSTKTLGADLVNVGVDDEIEPLSFNLFELIEKVKSGTEMSKENEKLIDNAVSDLVKAIEVEKTGKESMKINGTSVDGVVYHVVIPQDALEALLDVVIDAAESTDYEALVTDILLSIGAPEENVEDAVDEMGLSDSVDLGDAKDAVEDVLDALEDIELDVFVKGGYVMAVEYENKIEDVDVTLGIYMGGGKNLADNFSVVFEGDDGYSTLAIELVSAGNHTGAGGTFTDETTVEIDEDGYKEEITSELSYEPKGKGNNFSWIVDVDGMVEVEAEGQLTASGDKMKLYLEELAVEAMGMKVCAVELTYELDSFSMGVSAKKPIMLSTLDEDSIEDLGEEIVDLAEDWGEDVADKLPESVLDELYYVF